MCSAVIAGSGHQVYTWRELLEGFTQWGRERRQWLSPGKLGWQDMGLAEVNRTGRFDS